MDDLSSDAAPMNLPNTNMRRSIFNMKEKGYCSLDK